MSAVPPAFTPQTSFSTLAQQPILTSGLPGSELDGEFARASDSINQIKDRLSEIQRDDGKIRNGVVGTEALSDDVRNLFISAGTNPITWAIGIEIKVGDLVSNPPDTPGTYLCIVDHTSSSIFANDLSNWALIAAPPVVGVLYTNTFTGTGFQPSFMLSKIPASIDNTQVFIDGIYQPKSGYTLNGNILTFSPAPADGSDIEVSIGVPSTSNIVTVADGAISTVKLADLAVATGKIADNAVTTPKISQFSVTSSKIAASAITSGLIANAAVTNAKLAQLSVTADKIADESISTSKIAPLAVIGDRIANNSISTVKIQDNSITSAKIADQSIVTSKLAEAAVTESKIADNAVATAKIPDSAVTTSKIASAAVTPEKLSKPFTLGTAQATTSGTSINFTGIPSWVKRITVMISGVSTNGSSDFIARIGGVGGIENTGYASDQSDRGGGVSSTTGFILTRTTTARSALQGVLTFYNISGNSWVSSSNIAIQGNVSFAAGSKMISDKLTQIQITTVNETDIFDAGLISISYE